MPAQTNVQAGTVAYVPVTPGATPITEGTSQTRVVATAAPAPQASVPAVTFATGPIHDACRAAGRRGATRERCGCVQWVADRELTHRQQQRGARYFTDQQQLQEVRQSDDRSNSDFWQAWSRFGSRAGGLCRGT